MGVGVKDKFSVGIGGVGYILKGSPDHPAHIRRIVKSQVSRLAVSDIQYSDFANDGNFFTAQTDWSAGFKDDKEWSDDAKYWYSTNIDAYSEQGAIKLEKEVLLEKDFTNEVYCGGSYTVAGVLGCYVGTRRLSAGGNYIKIYQQTALGTWTDVAGTEFGADRWYASGMVEHKNNLWVLSCGDVTSDAVQKYTGSAWTDYTAAIDAVATGAVYHAPCACDYAGILYVFVQDNSAASVMSLMSTADDGTTWVEEFTETDRFKPASVIGYLDKLYYVKVSGFDMILYCFDITTNIKTTIEKFKLSSTLSAYGGFLGCQNLLRVYDGKLIITVPNKNVYSYDGTNLKNIYHTDDDKNSIGTEACAKMIAHGCGAVEANEKLYWGNLVYDGEVFYNHKKALGDSTTYSLVPLFSDNADRVYYADNSAANIAKIYRDDATYKGTLASNYLLFCEMGQIPSIDKMINNITVIHDKLLTGESFKVEYSIDNRTSWVAVGTKSFIGDTLTKKTWIIPGSILYNKIWIKVYMAGAGTTPKIRDVIVSYRPMPDYKNLWQMRLDFGDEIRLLNGQLEQRDSKELYSQFWNKMAVKQKMTFEDIDYCQCSLVSGMTSAATSCAVSLTTRFPRQGRIRVVSGSVSEEMYYTSAESRKIKGITRGARGTVARTYLSGTILKNDYDVYLDDLRTDTAFTDQKKSEDAAIVTLIEV